VTTTFQLSDKGGPSGQGILLIKVEAPDEVSPEMAYNVFAQAVQIASLDGTLDNFDALAKARETALAALPGAEVVVQHQTQPAAAAGAWGQPPVPPLQPSAPQLPAAAAAPAVGAAPACHHGTKEFISGITKSGKNAGKPWKAWACPADRDDPSKCEKDWIRD
jgi:hypothetical protein